VPGCQGETGDGRLLLTGYFPSGGESWMMMAKVKEVSELRPYRCQICGETYLGSTVPDRCPYCGVAGKHLLVAAEWVNHGAVELSPASRQYCQDALQLELSNAAFYKACSSKAENQITQSIFKRLSKQEAEHAELIAAMMGEEEPALGEEDCPAEDEQKFAQAHDREKRALQLYFEIVNSAPEPRMKEVFKALAEVEGEHLQVSNIYR
jgi:rubrerythrin